MSLEFSTLELLRLNHPAWRLLRSDHASLVAGFLQRVFLEPNVRVIEQADLVEALEDELFALRERHGPEAFPRPAMDYLTDWASNEKGWLRKFYRTGSDEPCFDVTPAAEKAIGWLASLGERSFVGTESRLLTLFELLRQMNEGSETDPEARLADLKVRREAIDAEMDRVAHGELPMLDDTAMRDRFQQFSQLARELLSDFREVESNFRSLDRRVRERIALWDGSKGRLVEEIMGERDAIAESDQGRSFRAFWDFLMSMRRQEEFTKWLGRVLELPAVSELGPEGRIGRIHYDWLEAGEHTQRTVALLSQQLRRFLDDQAWLENRRIMDILHGIEARALAVRERQPTGLFMEVAESAASVNLPMERPLYSVPIQPVIEGIDLAVGTEAIDMAALFNQVVVDRAELEGHIRAALRERSQVTLREVLEEQPLKQGLAELVAYLQLATNNSKAAVDEEVLETVEWKASDPNGEVRTKRAQLPRVVFVK